ncbi:MAG: GyrI-like domain-containing protein [Bacteroidota bacterium]
MSKTTIKEIHLIGLSLKTKTINTGGQSSADCKNLWHEFENANYAAIIPNKAGDEIYGVYHHYEGDSSKPFSYFIGCKVKAGTAAPAGLENLAVPAGTYEKIIVHGKMPDCVINAWKEIWAADYTRTYQTDFEVYDERTKDWNNAEVDVYVSVNE